MKENRGPWYLLTGVILGLVIGILVSLVVLPVRYTDTEPSSLRADGKDIYRALIGRAYLVEGDTPRALARLALLNDQNQAQVLVEQAHAVLTNGGSELDARSLALLAAAVAQPSIRITPIPVSVKLAILSTAIIPTETTILGTPTQTSSPAATKTLLATIAPRGTPTLQPTLGAPYELIKQAAVCDQEVKRSLLQVYVTDATDAPVPGVMVEISIPDGGSEKFYTGMYPEISPGYADYAMLEGMTYNLRVGQYGQLITGLSIPACENANAGSLRLDFKQP